MSRSAPKRAGYSRMRLSTMATTNPKSSKLDIVVVEEPRSTVPYRMHSLFVPYGKQRGLAIDELDDTTGTKDPQPVGDEKTGGPEAAEDCGAALPGSAAAPHKRRADQRLVFKNGECNVTRENIKKRRQRYLADIFTTLVDIKWRWNLLNFVLAFILSWLIFGLLWWLICFSHGDLQKYGQPGHRPCVEEVYDFTTALLFSIETQQTIGFGSRHTNPHCPEAILVMMFQSCFGVIIQALMTGLVFAKLSRPKKRAETLLFSKNAVVCKRDGRMCLLFRVGDMRKSHIVEAHVRAIMIKRRMTQEGETIPLYQYDLKLGDGETEGRLFMVWPVIVEHRINDESPLWEMSEEDLAKESFELVVVLEGIVESTGMTTQARTSYLPDEILWGHRFERLVTFQRDSGQYLIDYSKFHSTIALEIPRCSAKDLEESQRSDISSDNDEDDDDDDDYDYEEQRPDTKDENSTWIPTQPNIPAILPPHRHHHQQQRDETGSHQTGSGSGCGGGGGDDDLAAAKRRRTSIQSLLRKNGLNGIPGITGIALAAFDLEGEEEEDPDPDPGLNIVELRYEEGERNNGQGSPFNYNRPS